MKKTIALAIILLLVQISCFAEQQYPRRIVSLSPGITEILYELGLGDRIAGVTDYCDYPDGVKGKARVGGYLDTNYEAIILLEPDLVIIPAVYSEEIKDVFKEAGIEYITVDMLTVDGILVTIEEIGRKCGTEKKADEVIRRIHADISGLRKKVKEGPPARFMIVVGRNRGTFENLYIAGKNTFYGELLDIMGCENVYTESDISYPAISLEGVIRLNPDVVIEMLPDIPDEKKGEIIGEWAFLKDVNAVKNGRVYVFNEDYVCIPGPRFTLILNNIVDIL